MKKLAFVFAAVVAVSFASCGNKTAQAEETDTVAIEETECVCDSACTDSTACDSTCAGECAEAPAAE
ncbi:MAG: hypothetical protein II681_01100 [Bacteroidaceae bacterium]|nr:hypothetical protein [Bacteroidaceae bacterium]MBQ3992185.1 hypothetical protein [Bacteroidaceae bacterium]